MSLQVKIHILYNTAYIVHVHVHLSTHCYYFHVINLCTHAKIIVVGLHICLVSSAGVHYSYTYSEDSGWWVVVQECITHTPTVKTAGGG